MANRFSRTGLRAMLIGVPLVLAAVLAWSQDSKDSKEETAYYMCIFAYETSPRTPQTAHTFATFIKSAGKSFEAKTISWLPRDKRFDYCNCPNQAPTSTSGRRLTSPGPPRRRSTNGGRFASSRSCTTARCGRSQDWAAAECSTRQSTCAGVAIMSATASMPSATSTRTVDCWLPARAMESIPAPPSLSTSLPG